MDITNCYRLLELESGATLAEIKASYRRLARQYHPDLNPNDSAQEKFIALNQAYNLLTSVLPPEAEEVEPVSTAEPVTQNTATSQQQWVTKVVRKEKPTQDAPPLTPAEEQLKQRTYQKIQALWRQQKFNSAIALAESLVNLLPQDPEICQWQAIAYQRWGRQLLNENKLDKARIYLKKALKTDPHNRSLWSEVDRDFRRLEKMS